MKNGSLSKRTQLQARWLLVHSVSSECSWAKRGESFEGRGLSDLSAFRGNFLPRSRWSRDGRKSWGGAGLIRQSTTRRVR